MCWRSSESSIKWAQWSKLVIANKYKNMKRISCDGTPATLHCPSHSFEVSPNLLLRSPLLQHRHCEPCVGRYFYRQILLQPMYVCVCVGTFWKKMRVVLVLSRASKWFDQLEALRLVASFLLNKWHHKFSTTNIHKRDCIVS